MRWEGVTWDGLGCGALRRILGPGGGNISWSELEREAGRLHLTLPITGFRQRSAIVGLGGLTGWLAG